MGSRDVCLVFVWCVTHLYLEKMESYCDAKVDLYSSFSLYLFFFFFFFFTCLQCSIPFTQIIPALNPIYKPNLHRPISDLLVSPKPITKLLNS
jgi:hypothetical protein